MFCAVSYNNMYTIKMWLKKLIHLKGPRTFYIKKVVSIKLTEICCNLGGAHQKYPWARI